LVERLKKLLFPLRFSGETADSIVLPLWLLWNIWCFPLCFLGFGEDTDAWLMAQTIQKLKQGLPYDPARSLGNPLYEFAASLLPFLPLGRLTNFINLLLANFFLFRIKAFFPFSSPFSLGFTRLALMCMPFFQEAATSSMEYIPAWLLFFETRRALHFKNPFWFFAGLVMCSFLRIEFFLFLRILFSTSKRHSNLQIFLWIFCLGLISFYLGWVWGKNPAPFSDLPSALSFYGGRLMYLLRQAGLLLPAYLVPFFLVSGLKRDFFMPSEMKTNILFFIIFPFEWAYIFPVWLWSANVLADSDYSHPRLLLLPVVGFFLGFFTVFPPGWGMPAQVLKRKLQLKWLDWAEKQKPEKPEILLHGATFIPWDYQKWEKVLDNRIFRKRGSLLYVGEKLQEAELDSLFRLGFRVRVADTDSVRYANKIFPVQVIRP
jgi:hypothetical protein